MKNLKKMLVLGCLALVLMVVFTDFAHAAATVPGGTSAGGNDLMESTALKAATLFQRVKTIIFVVGGFGLVGIAFQAIFGKVKWTWFAGLAIGLAILAAAGAIIEYATGGNVNTGYMGDSYQNTMV